MLKRKLIVATISAAATLPGLAFAKRLLVQDHAASVYLEQNTNCGAPVQIRVNSNNADVFSGDSIELQRYTDVARALMGFECGDVFEVKVDGYLNGIIDPLFSGVANASTGWLLQVNQSIALDGGAASQDLIEQSSTQPASPTEPATYPDVTINEPREDNVLTNEQYGASVYQDTTTDDASIEQHADDRSMQKDSYSVAGLRLGMRLDTAVRSVGDVFKESPRYDSANRLLTVEEGGCYADYDWEKRPTSPLPGWRCLTATFDNHLTPEVAGLTLTQVAPKDNDEAAYQALIERFGQPAMQKESRRSGDPFGIFGKPIKHLAWGETTEADGDESEYELKATIENWRDVTILTLNMNDTESKAPTSDSTAQAFQF